jgi:hypothetical protein
MGALLQLTSPNRLRSSQQEGKYRMAFRRGNKSSKVSTRVLPWIRHVYELYFRYQTWNCALPCQIRPLHLLNLRTTSFTTHYNAMTPNSTLNKMPAMLICVYLDHFMVWYYVRQEYPTRRAPILLTRPPTILSNTWARCLFLNALSNWVHSPSMTWQIKLRIFWLFSLEVLNIRWACSFFE